MIVAMQGAAIKRFHCRLIRAFQCGVSQLKVRQIKATRVFAELLRTDPFTADGWQCGCNPIAAPLPRTKNNPFQPFLAVTLRPRRRPEHSNFRPVIAVSKAALVRALMRKLSSAIKEDFFSFDIIEMCELQNDFCRFSTCC
jgi:hypothetical protein